MSLDAGQVGARRDDMRLPLLAWLSFLLGAFPFGLFIAYTERAAAEGPRRDTYTYMIRTFWIGLVYALAAFVLMTTCAAGVGLFPGTTLADVSLVAFYVPQALVALWYVARCVNGLVLTLRRAAVARPATWWV